jgi:hypothetical protein
MKDKFTFDSDHGTIGIPMILGVKSNLSKSLIIGLESGAKITFADDIDGSYQPMKLDLSEIWKYK